MSIDNREEPKVDIVPIKEIIFKDYLPYWPYFILSTFLAVLCAFIYLRYQVAQYQVNATMMVKAEKEGINTMVEKLVGGQSGSSSNNNINDKLFVLQSQRIKMLAVKLAKVQVLIVTHGKVSTNETYQNLPFQINLLEPDSVIDFQADFQCDQTGKGLRINGVLYPFNRMTLLGGNKLVIQCQEPKRCVNDKVKYTLNLLSLASAADANTVGLGAKPYDKGSSIINLSLTTNIPRKGVKVLDALMQAYKMVSMDEKLMQAKNTIQFIDERLRVLSGDLDSVEGSIEAFKRSNGIADISAESQLFLENVTESDKMLSQLDLQLSLLNDLENYVVGRGKSPGLVPSLIGLPDGGYTSSLLSKLYEAELKLQELRGRNGDKSDIVAVAKGEIQTMKESLYESIQNVRKNLQTLRREYNAKAGKYSELMRDIPSKERKLLNITRQQVVKNGLYTFLLEKREEAAIQYSATLGDVQVLQSATANYTPVSPNVGRTYGLSVFFALTLVIGILFLRKTLNYKLQYRSEIERVTGIPVLDEIVQVDSDSPLVMKDGNRTLIAEQFRSLRTNLGYYKTAVPDKASILVSSSIPAEGKSFVSTNLAISYSLIGLKTVLIESDMRKPNIAKHFEIKRRLGLSSYLIGSASQVEVTIESGIQNLWVIPAGPIPPNPAELIMGSSRYADLLTELLKEYDRVVIDCPPIGLVTDAQLLCDIVDVSLFVCRHNHTPKLALVNILNPLYLGGKFHQMGLVFNGVNQQANGYGYGSYGYGYGSYGYGYGSYGYGYGYYGESNKKDNKWTRFFNLLFAPIWAPLTDLKGMFGKSGKEKK